MESKKKAKVYTVRECAEILNMNVCSAYDAIHRGDIPHIKIGGRLLVPKAKLDAMLGVAG